MSAFSYTYDDLWRPVRTITPSGLLVDNEYDAYGNLSKIKNVSTTFWELKGLNAKGQITAFELGSGVSAAYDYYANGLIKRQYAAAKNGRVVQDMQYEYDADTYSLTMRNDVKNNRREVFNYDELDRLTSTRLNGVLSDSVSYQPNGNIQARSGVGTYQYGRTKPHAVSGIQGSTAGAAVTGIMQEITYTPFNKVQSVQHSGGNNDRYETAYGLDEQRIKTSYYQKGIKQYDRYYFGTYEKEVNKNGGIVHIDYIYTPSGLSAACIIPTSGPSDGGIPALYYVHTDNLGSIQAVTDDSGTIQAAYAYTAWGGQLTLKSPRPRGLKSFNRGYTGHEHLEPLGLINMNGRIYDPVLARFLSPDPYVQAPDYTQGFNRYSYCLNNPFKYTDPSGEFWHLIIGGVIGGISNVLFNLKNIDNFWQGLGYFGVGAVAGVLSSGVATGVSTALSGASFWAGFVGSPQGISTILSVGYTNSFVNGFAVGSAGGFVSTFGTQFGNSLMEGNTFGKSLMTGVLSGIIGGISGGLIGGIGDGLIAKSNGFDFLDGGINLDERVKVISEKYKNEMQEGSVSIIRKGENMGQANGRIIRGKRYNLPNGEVGFEDNIIELSKLTIRRIWKGEVRGLETLNHEFLHAKDYSNGFYSRLWNLESSKSVDINKVTEAFLEFRAFSASYMRTNINDYAQMAAKWYNIYISLIIP